VEAILKANLKTDLSSTNYNLCSCTCGILQNCGSKFHQWMQDNIIAGREFHEFSDFSLPVITLCPDIPFKPETAGKIKTFLSGKYESYKKVSYFLWKVVYLLGKLKNTYPGATLHDCDDGSDQNPVRLGNTALGNYPVIRNVTL
jgi:hypothetical protein